MTRLLSAPRTYRTLHATWRAACHMARCVETGCATTRIMDAAEERRLTLLEQQVGALLAGRERMGDRIRKLREYIASNCPHSALDTNCPTCQFLQEDAK